MKTFRNMLYDWTIGRKWIRLNYELATEDAREFERAVYMARLDAKANEKAIKYMDKAIKKAARAL